jgi:hypothetical protein
MGTRTLAGLWNIDFPGVSGEAPASDFPRGRVTSTPTTTISTPAGRAFPLPSKSSNRAIEPSTSTLRYDISRLQNCASHASAYAIDAHADCSLLHRSATAEPSCGRCQQSALPATRMTIGRYCMRRRPHDLPSWASQFHFRSSFSCGSTTDVAELRIWAVRELQLT